MSASGNFPLPSRPVVIATDPGGDDALALMLALRSVEIQAAALLTVAGNVPVSQSTARTRRLLACLNLADWPPVLHGVVRPWRCPLYIATQNYSLPSAAPIRLSGKCFI